MRFSRARFLDYLLMPFHQHHHYTDHCLSRHRINRPQEKGYQHAQLLFLQNPREVQVTALEHTIIVDTRDCIGKRSLADTQAIFEARGGRPDAQGFLTDVSGSAVNPIQ